MDLRSPAEQNIYIQLYIHIHTYTNNEENQTSPHRNGNILNNIEFYRKHPTKSIHVYMHSTHTSFSTLDHHTLRHGFASQPCLMTGGYPHDIPIIPRVTWLKSFKIRFVLILLSLSHD